MANALEATRISQASLPVIDIAGLSSKHLVDRQKVGARLRAACLSKGFFYVKNHGVPEPLVANVFKEAAAFFALPTEEKLQLETIRAKGNRGYQPLQGQVLEAGTPPDLKEGFYIGPEHRADDPKVIAGMFNHGPNRWPQQLPDFRPAMRAYFDVMLALAVRMMGGLALSLNLPEDYFADYCREPMAAIRLLHYPPQPANAAPGQKGAGAHTDFGGLTLLRQDDVGGLQVWDQGADSWIHVEPLPETYVVNLGDLIARWTNDQYRSTFHRVINASGRERYSVPFFFTGNYAHTVDCIPSCLAAGEAPKYAPTTVEAHIREMYGRTYKRGFPGPSS